MSFERDGFLSEQIRHRFSNGEPECRDWFPLARRFNAAVHATISAPRDIRIEKEWDAKALVHLLYFRALSNFQGAVLLADRGLIVESRGLTRMAAETALCMVGAKIDPGHWQALIADEKRSRRGRGRLILKNQWLAPEVNDKLAADLELMDREGNLAAKLDYDAISKRAGCQIHYVLYRELSADAAHTSLASLFRYVVEGEDGSIGSLQPFAKVSAADIAGAVDAACNFLFLASSVFLEFFPDAMPLAPQLSTYWEEYKVLAARHRGKEES